MNLNELRDISALVLIVFLIVGAIILLNDRDAKEMILYGSCMAMVISIYAVGYFIGASNIPHAAVLLIVVTLPSAIVFYRFSRD